MRDHYVETETRFTQSGRQVNFVYDPQRMSLHSLAKAVHYKKAQKPEEFAKAFGERSRWIIGEVLSTKTLPSKPSRVQVENFRQYGAELKQIWEYSAERVIEIAIKGFDQRRGVNKNIDQKPIGAKDGPNIKDVNASLFIRKLLGVARAYIEGGQADLVLGDLYNTKSVVEDPSKFILLEEMCRGPLNKFVTDWRVTGMDRESQMQEGLMVVWQCAKEYKGKNFARFSTFVKTALRNKAIDLARSLSAHKRRTWKRTSLEGVGEEGSRLADMLDWHSFENWVYQRDGDEEASLVPLPRTPISEFETKYAVFEGTTDEVDDTNSPVGLERRVELMSQGQLYFRLEDKSRIEEFQEWVAECRDKSLESNPVVQKTKTKKKRRWEQGPF